jgi:hypothetical protein
LRSEAIFLGWDRSSGGCRVAGGPLPASCLTRHAALITSLYIVLAMTVVLGLIVIDARALIIAYGYEQDIDGCDCDIHIISADFVS